MEKSESKVQKVSRKTAKDRQSNVLFLCGCGGEVMWARYEKRMRKCCMGCGKLHA